MSLDACSGSCQCRWRCQAAFLFVSAPFSPDPRLSETETKVNEISHLVWDDICFATFRGAVTMPAKSPATARTGPAEPLLQEVLRIRQIGSSARTSRHGHQLEQSGHANFLGGSRTMSSYVTGLGTFQSIQVASAIFFAPQSLRPDANQQCNLELYRL